MKRLLICLLAAVVLGLAGCEVDVDGDIRLTEQTQQIEITTE